MPKYDAFGREVGEDTLAGLRGSEAGERSVPAPETVSAPAAVPGPEAPPRPAPAPAAPRPVRPLRRTRGLGCLVALVILAAVVAGPVIALVTLVGDADDVLGGLAIPEQGPTPTGLGGRSMLAPDRMAAGLGRLRAEGIHRVTLIRVAPERIDVQGTRGGVATTFQLRHDGGEHGSDGGTPPADTFRVAAVDPAAPARLARRAARRGGFRADARIDYAVATVAPRGRGHRWLAYFDGGVFAEGDPQGRLVRLIRP